MANQEIVIDIRPDGTVRMEGEGFVGPECDHFMGELEAAIGVVEKRQNKPEYARRNVVAAVRKAGR